MALGVMAFRYQPKQAIGIGPDHRDRVGREALFGGPIPEGEPIEALHSGRCRKPDEPVAVLHGLRYPAMEESVLHAQFPQTEDEDVLDLDRESLELEEREKLERKWDDRDLV